MGHPIRRLIRNGTFTARVLRRGHTAMRLALVAVLSLVGAEAFAAAPAAKVVRFNTEDGVTLVADFVAPRLRQKGRPAPLVILLHMYMQDRTTWAPLVPELHKRGYAMLAIDLRGHGESIVGPPSQNLPERVAKRHKRVFRAMHRDVAAAYQWATRVADETGAIDMSRLALIGASVGASVAIDYAARDRSVDVVICLSPGVNYMGIDSVAHSSKLGNRAFLMLADPSEKAAPQALAALAGNADVTLLAGAGHGTRMFGAIQDLPTQIADYLDAHIGQPTDQPVVASINSDVFHNPTSGTAKRISAANRRWFSSADEAKARGLRPGRTRRAQAKK